MKIDEKEKKNASIASVTDCVCNLLKSKVWFLLLSAESGWQLLTPIKDSICQ